MNLRHVSLWIILIFVTVPAAAGEVRRNAYLLRWRPTLLVFPR